MSTTPKRARRLETRGFATRHAERRDRMRRRVNEASTAEEQLAAAYDWFRLSVAHDADPRSRGRLLRDAAQYLTSQAIAIEEGGDGS